MACGRWLVTDGAVLSNSVEMGEISAREAALEVRQGPNGPETLIVTYKARVPLRGETEIVTDSGDVVLCSEAAFRKWQIDDRSSALLLRSAVRSCPNADAILIHDPDDECVAIVSAPPFGDGAYGLYFETEGELQSLRIELAESR